MVCQVSKEFKYFDPAVNFILLVRGEELAILLLVDDALLGDMQVEAGRAERAGLTFLEVLALLLGERVLIRRHELLLGSSCHVDWRRTDEECFQSAQWAAPEKKIITKQYNYHTK